MGSSSGEVLGEWKDFIFEMGDNSNNAEACQHVRDFFLRDEPLNVLLGWCDENAANHDEMVKLALSHGLSLIIRHKGTKEIAGINLTLDSRLPGFDSIFPSEFKKSSHLTKILTILGRIEELGQKNFQEKFPSEYHADFFITSVASKFRGIGIAKESYIRTMNLLRTRGFTVVRVAFTSPGTRIIGSKLGFTELGKIFYKDQKNDNDELIFPTADSDEGFVTDNARFL